MLFWRKKKNAAAQEEEAREDKIIHHPNEPDLEPAVEYDSDFTAEQEEVLHEDTDSEVLDNLEEMPVPDRKRFEDMAEDMAAEEELIALEEADDSAKKPEAAAEDEADSVDIANAQAEQTETLDASTVAAGKVEGQVEEKEVEPEIQGPADIQTEDVKAEPEPQPEAPQLKAQAEAEAQPESKPEPEPEDKGGWFSRLTGGLSKSSAKIGQGIADLVTKRKLDQDMLDELEEVLITADLGPKTAARIVAEFGQDRFGKDISADEVKAHLAGSISKILDPVARPMSFDKPAEGNGPLVVLVCGVNGVGKTTTIGKIAYDLAKRSGKKITLGAGDTFRAAAVEQLEIWAQRAGAGFVKKDLGADAAALAYESYEKAKADGADVLFIDTAGRLHNKANLMAELEKIVRVLKKHDENIPHATLLVLDATTGQNAHAQLETFKQMVNVTGLVVTKLDGSAKGGVVVSLADQYGLPIHYIGVGETAEDLRPFAADDFARSLVGAVA